MAQVTRPERAVRDLLAQGGGQAHVGPWVRHLHLPRSEAVRGARERPLLTAVSCPFWHGTWHVSGGQHLASPPSGFQENVRVHASPSQSA